MIHKHHSQGACLRLIIPLVAVLVAGILTPAVHAAPSKSPTSVIPDTPNYILCSKQKAGVVAGASQNDAPYTLYAYVWGMVDYYNGTYCNEPLWCSASIYEGAGAAGGNLEAYCYYGDPNHPDTASYNPTPNGPYPNGATYSTSGTTHRTNVQCEHAKATFNVSGGASIYTQTSDFCG